MQTKETTGKISRLETWLRKPLGKHRQGVEGQALVEFALTLPFLILIFVVLVELGFLIRSHMTISIAAREGVRVTSTRGNAEPAAIVDATGLIVGGNDVSTRVGADGDSVMVQAVNTALNEERRNVTMLMSYRADMTESPNAGDLQNGVVTKIGWYGLGGEKGVYYNSSASIHPFQEVFTFTQRANGERWFSPAVMSTAECANLYGSAGKFGSNFEPATYLSKTNQAGQAYNGTFCGDASKISNSTGIDRRVPLGQIYTDYPTTGNTINNASPIQGKPRFPAGGNCNPYSGTPPSVPYNVAIQCTRYSVAPWYPTLRRAGDVGFSPSDNPQLASYYNKQGESAAYFGCESDSQVRSPDYIGIQVSYRHNWFLTFFPGGIDLSDKAVKVMEPVGGNFSAPNPPSKNQTIVPPALIICA